MLARAGGRLSLTTTFASTAAGYWLGVFPQVTRELRGWRGRAELIADGPRRELALRTQREERGNIEGAAAFATLAPRRRRPEVVRAAVAFQVLYDYLDALAEQPATASARHARSLHRALPAALGGSAASFGACSVQAADTGYVGALVAACATACRALPSFAIVAGAVERAAARMVVYQALNHAPTRRLRESSMRRWAQTLATPAGALEWWEAAAAAASSLGVFALLAAAAEPSLTSAQAGRIERAYFPWIGALHVLLDSLVDLEADARSGDHSLLCHYGGEARAAERLGLIAERAIAGARGMSGAPAHELILAAMCGFYLSSRSARRPPAAPAAAAVEDALGPALGPSLAVLRLRRCAAALARGRPSPAR